MIPWHLWKEQNPGNPLLLVHWSPFWTSDLQNYEREKFLFSAPPLLCKVICYGRDRKQIQSYSVTHSLNSCLAAAPRQANSDRLLFPCLC